MFYLLQPTLIDYCACYVLAYIHLKIQATIMFSFFKKDPLKQLNKQYSAKLEQAMFSQRNGDIKGYSQLTFEAEQILDKIKTLENKIT